jgi:hypothetical protein
MGFNVINVISCWAWGGTQRATINSVLTPDHLLVSFFLWLFLCATLMFPHHVVIEALCKWQFRILLLMYVFLSIVFTRAVHTT